MKPYALVPCPMTPPDEPRDPDLSGALLCPGCGYTPTWESRHCETEYRLFCICVIHLSGPWADDIDRAVQGWNCRVEHYSERLKAEGQQQVAENNEVWLLAAVKAITEFAQDGREFTAQHLRPYCAMIGVPSPQSPNAWGAAFSVAAKQGLIVRCGYAKNKLASAHARVVAVWKGAK